MRNGESASKKEQPYGSVFMVHTLITDSSLLNLTDSPPCFHSACTILNLVPCTNMAGARASRVQHAYCQLQLANFHAGCHCTCCCLQLQMPAATASVAENVTMPATNAAATCGAGCGLRQFPPANTWLQLQTDAYRCFVSCRCCSHHRC